MDATEFKALRARLRLSQQEFGEMLGFAKTAARNRVSEIERGVSPVSRKTEAICKLIGRRKR